MELKDGLNSFQSNAFESLYDKKVTWAKNSSSTESKETTIESQKPVVISLPPVVAVVEKAIGDAADDAAEIIDEAPMAKKVVDVVASTAAKIIVPVPAIIKEIPAKVVDTVVAAVTEKVTVSPPAVTEKAAIVPPMATKVVQKEVVPVASKSVVEAKKGGGFFGFLQSDTAVQQIANKNQPTAPPAIAKAFMTPATTPGKAEVKKEARKSPEGLNMAMFKQDPEEIEQKKAMMAARPSLASAKAEAAKSTDDRIPSGAPIKAPEVMESAKGMFSFLTPPEASESEEKVAPAMAMAKKSVTAVTKAIPQPPAPTPVKKAPAPGGMFSFLTSDPSLVAPGDPDARPTAPPAVARAFMTPTAVDLLKDGEVVSAAAIRRKAEFDQDVKDEAVKNQMMAARPSIADLKVEASKTLSKQQMRDAAAKAAGKATVTKAPTPGFFDFFTQDSESSGDGDLFEPRDPNAMTEKEVAMTIAPTVKAVVAPKRAAAVPVPPPKAATATPPPASGGMFGFLNSGPAAKATPVEPKVVPAVAMAKKAAPAPAPVVKAPAPAAASGGMFGFLNSGPTVKPPQEVPAVTKAAPAAISKVAIKASPVASSKPSPASGGFFGFLGSSAPSEPSKVETKVTPAVPTAKKVVPAPPKVAVNVKAAAPSAAAVSEKSDAPSGGFFGFLNSSPPQEPKARSTSTSSASVASSSSKPAVAVGMNVKFLASISRLLKGDSSKIKAFQSATDSFRSGAVSGDSFLKTLEALFGSDALESVVVPLVSELPERDAAVKLRASFDKKMSSMKRGTESAKAPFSFSFGAPKKVEVPVPAVVAPPPKKEGFSFPSFGAPKAPATTPIKATATAIKIPTGVPAGKKTAVESQIKQLVAGGDVKVFYKNISKELGRPKTVEVMPEIIKGLPKPIGVKVEAILKADK